MSDAATALVIGAGYLTRFLVESLPGAGPIITVRRTALPTGSVARVRPRNAGDERRAPRQFRHFLRP
jgi:hypothetical protein